MGVTLRNKTDFVEEVICILETNSSVDIFCMHQIFPYILYPENEVDFLHVREVECKQRCTLMGFGPLVSRFHAAFFEAYKRGVTFRYVMGVSSLAYYRHIMDLSFKHNCPNVLSDVASRLKGADVSIHVVAQAPNYCMYIGRSKCLFAIIDAKNPGTITNDRSSIQTHSRAFEKMYGSGRPLECLWPNVHAAVQSRIGKITGNRDSDQYDIFLSYNSVDRSAAMLLAFELQSRGLRVWVDEWELLAGRIWQEDVERVIRSATAAAILFGPTGLGQWQEMEMRVCITQFVELGLRVIPVILPGADLKAHIPSFLRELSPTVEFCLFAAAVRRCRSASPCFR